MKKIFAGLFLTASFAFASAQTISFDKTTIDYGTVSQNSDGHREYIVTNTGDKPLIVSNVVPSCGCTTPEWTKDPILPGKSGKIKVLYNTAIVAPFQKIIEVYSNDAANSRSVITIKGDVNDSVATSNESIAPQQAVQVEAAVQSAKAQPAAKKPAPKKLEAM